MDMIDIAIAKAFATKVAAGFSNVEVDGMTINFTLNDGTTTSLTVPTPADGVSVADIDINENGNLICTMSDGTEIDAGKVTPTKGVDYYTPEEIEEVKEDILTDLQGRIDLLTSEYTITTSENSNDMIIENAINYYNQGNIKIGDGPELEQETTSISEGDEYDSPSPDHPQNIKVVEGECSVKVSNKNFLDLTEYSNSTNPKWGTSSCTTSNKSANYVILESTGTYSNVSLLYDDILRKNANITITGVFKEMMENRTSNIGFFIAGSNDGTTFTSIANSQDTVSTNVSKKLSVTGNVENYKYIRIRIYANNSGTSGKNLSKIELSNFMIAYGTSNEFIAHIEQNYPITLPEGMFLSSISTVSNYIYGTKDNWKLHSGLRKKILNGSETWNTTSQDNVFYTTLSDVDTNRSTFTGFKCTDYKYHGNVVTQLSSLSNNECGAMTSSSTTILNRFFVKNTQCSTASDIDTAFSNQNATLYYQMVTTDVPITDTTLITQLNDIANNLQTYKDETIIFTTSEDLAPNIQFNYFTNLNESSSNKVINISSESTDEQYPSAKAVYDYINANINSVIGGSY